MGSVFLRNGSWTIEYKEHGKLKRKSVGKRGVVTKTMAREILNEEEKRIKKGQYGMLDGITPSLSEITPEFINYQKEIRQKKSVRDDIGALKRLNLIFGDKKLNEITSKDIDDYKERRLKKVKPATLNKELGTLRRLFNVVKRWKRFYGENPVSESGLIPDNNPKEKILSYEDQKRLFDVSPDHFKSILVCALNTGMRKGEIISLKWDNVDLETNIITLEHTNTKSKKSRRIPINSVLRKMLLEQRIKTANSDYVFHSAEGTPYKRSDSLNRIWRYVLKESDIQGLRFHDLRHTAATRMVEAGGNIVAVSRILGHSDLKITMRYAHPDNSLVEAAEALTKTPFSDSLTDKSTDIKS